MSIKQSRTEKMVQRDGRLVGIPFQKIGFGGWGLTPNTLESCF